MELHLDEDGGFSPTSNMIIDAGVGFMCKIHLEDPYCSSSSFEPCAPGLLTVHCQAVAAISVDRRRLYILHTVHVQMKPKYQTPAFYSL